MVGSGSQLWLYFRILQEPSRPQCPGHSPNQLHQNVAVGGGAMRCEGKSRASVCLNASCFQ